MIFNKRVVGVDPGSMETALVVWDGTRVLEKMKAMNQVIVAALYRLRTMGGLCAIEQIVGSYGGVAGRELMDAAHWSGRFAQAWVEGGAAEWSLIMVPRKTAVTQICGTGNAGDAGVRQALIDRIGGKGTVKEPGPLFGMRADMFSALAVAVCAFDRAVIGAYDRELVG